MLQEAVNDPLGRKLRMGLIGGGGNGFIGRVHALAAQLDHRAVLVAGALSSDPTRARAAAAAFDIPAERAYGSYRELLDVESSLPDDERIDFVSIATPNDTHFEIASAALKTGLDVVCDKPLTTRVEDAEHLAGLVGQAGRVFLLTHNYSGYPLVRQARAMIQAGELGEIQSVRVNYIQGYLCGVLPGTVPSRGVWKLDPQRAGSGSLGDIGTHAFHLGCYVTGLSPTHVASTLRTFHAERPLEDYGHVLVRWGDALGCITFSQITHGRLNDLSLEIDGTKASLSWRQEDPNQLVLRQFGEPAQIYDRHPNAAYTKDPSRQACRLPAGHPEAFVEAFANIYCDAFDAMVALRSRQETAVSSGDFPTVHDGVQGVRFVVACQESAAANGAWVEI